MLRNCGCLLVPVIACHRPEQSVKLVQRYVNGIVLPFVWLVDLSGVGGSYNGNIQL